MTDFSKPTAPPSPWVGLWKGRRHVVFDPSIQPSSIEYMLLYFVQGQSLCVRKRVDDRLDVRTVRDSRVVEFSISQYEIWKFRNQSLLSLKRESTSFEIEQPDAIRRKCRVCEGNPHSTWTVGTFSDGAHSDGENMSEYCLHCNGRGFVDNTIEV
jgi:hypothetical protein